MVLVWVSLTLHVSLSKGQNSDARVSDFQTHVHMMTVNSCSSFSWKTNIGCWNCWHRRNKKLHIFEQTCNCRVWFWRSFCVLPSDVGLCCWQITERVVLSSSCVLVVFMISSWHYRVQCLCIVVRKRRGYSPRVFSSCSWYRHAVVMFSVVAVWEKARVLWEACLGNGFLAVALSLGGQHMENAAAGFLGVVDKPPSPSVPQSSPFEGDRKMKLIIIEKRT